MGSSETLKEEDCQEAWKNLDNIYLENGLPTPMTRQWLEDINEQLRIKKSETYLAPELTKSIEFRTSRVEVSDPKKKMFYLPGHQVVQEMDGFIQWLNKEIENCDSSISNPIIIAGLAYQRFVTIHPFEDGNGRTGRFLADLILRRYKLLPAAWQGDDFCVAINPINDKPVKPVDAVTRIISALQKSYEIVKAKNEY